MVVELVCHEMHLDMNNGRKGSSKLISPSKVWHFSQWHDPSEPGSALGRSTEWFTYFNCVHSFSWPSISNKWKVTWRQGVKQSINFSYGEETMLTINILLSHSVYLIRVLVSKGSDLNILKMMQVSVFPVAYNLKINSSLISKQICLGETWPEFNTRITSICEYCLCVFKRAQKQHVFYIISIA